MSFSEDGTCDDAFYVASQHGGFMDLLDHIPYDEWNYRRHKDGNSFLNYICLFGKTVFQDDSVRATIALLKQYPELVNTENNQRETPIQHAVLCQNYRLVQVLLVFGANIKFLNRNLIFLSVSSSMSFAAIQTTKVLIANGCRLNHHHEILSPFQRNVLTCRGTIVIILGLKRKKRILPKLDRFLIQQELAVAIWSTRSEEGWSYLLGK